MTKQEFLELRVLGVLSSKIKFEEKYSITLKSDTIKKAFLNQAKITDEEYEQYIISTEDEAKRIGSLANKERREGFGSRKLFLEWYLKIEKKCCYCGIKEEELNKYFNKNNLQYLNSKRERGTSLEIERIITEPQDKNVYSECNSSLACYICNNAKSDFISPVDFKPIAQGINQFWQEQGAKIESFNELEFWDKVEDICK